MRNILFFILLFAFSLSVSQGNANTLSKEQALSILKEWDKEVRQIENTSADNDTLREKDLELEFVNRLIFQVERNYQGSEARKFFLSVIWDMYLTDKNKLNQSFGSSDLFLSVLHQALEDILEPQENAVIFIKNFTRFSSIQDPVEIEEYATTRNYFDGKTTLKASPMESYEAAEMVDEKLKKADLIEGYNLLEDVQDLRSEFPKF